MCTAAYIKSVFEEIKTDNTSGSGALLKKLIDRLSGCNNVPSAWSENESAEIYGLFTVFRDDMSDFAVITHFCNFMIDCIRKKKVKDSDTFLQFVKRYSDDWKDVNDRIAGNFIAKVNLKGKTVLLHSQSSAVISLFEKVREDAGNINIIQTESRPVYEGRLQAKRLAGPGYKVRLVTDTGFTPLFDDIDYAILGADRIYNDFFINKAGSYAIALLCREKSVPLYVLADSRKILNTNLPAGYKEEMRPAGEVWGSPPSGITPVNYYFEAVPVDLITRLISEK